MSLGNLVTGALVAAILLLGGICLWQRTTIAELERKQAIMEIANAELIEKNKDKDTIIKERNDSIKKKDEQIFDIARQFDAISRKYRNAITVPIRKEEVLNDEMRKDLRDSLISPLPHPDNGLRQ